MYFILSIFLLITVNTIFYSCSSQATSEEILQEKSTSGYGIPLRKTLEKIVQGNQTFTFSLPFQFQGIEGFFTGKVQISELEEAVFESQSAYKRVDLLDGIIEVGDKKESFTQDYYFYLDSAFKPLGYVGNTIYAVFGQVEEIPITSQVPGAGLWYKGVAYSSSLKDQVVGELIVTYSLEDESPAHAKLTVREEWTMNSFSLNPSRVIEILYWVSPSGEVELKSRSTNEFGQEMVIRFD